LTQLSTGRTAGPSDEFTHECLAIRVARKLKAIHDVKLLRVLTDRGSEFCGNPERHEYELYLAVEDIDHSRTKTKSPQTNGICERFHKTALNEFYRVAFRKKVYRSIDELQADLDPWIREYNEQRPHQGRWCFGKTPMQTFLDAMPMTKEKMIAA
jgi:transposase InsO family protein